MAPNASNRMVPRSIPSGLIYKTLESDFRKNDTISIAFSFVERKYLWKIYFFGSLVENLNKKAAFLFHKDFANYLSHNLRKQELS